MKTVVTYQFSAFPATYWAKDRKVKNPKHCGYKGYRFDVLSKFSYDTLAEARREVRRLRKIYKQTGRDEKDYTGFEKEVSFLQIFKVEKTPIEDKR